MPGSFFSRVLKCLFCQTGPPTHQKPPQSSGPDNAQPSAQVKVHKFPPTKSQRPESSRTPSNSHLNVPMEFVNREDELEKGGPAQQIIGRRSSYSVGTETHVPGGQASSSNSSFVTSSLERQPPLPSQPTLTAANMDQGLTVSKSASGAKIMHPTEVPEAEFSELPEGKESLLGPQSGPLQGRKCLVLDLDETLVHSSFKYLPEADFMISVEIDQRVHNVFVVKRPGVDEFLTQVGKLFEVVVFTASVAKYGDPLLDHLNVDGVIHHRLFRESCYNYNGNYIKNLSMLGRPLNQVIIIDNSPASYALHPQHAVPVSSWFSDAHDNELLDMVPFLTDLASKDVEDVSKVLDVSIIPA